MRNEVFVLLSLAVVSALGSGKLPATSNNKAQAFNYSGASAAERKAYLERAGAQLKHTFKPNFVAKPVEFTTGGRSLSFSYNMRMSKIDCDTDYTCEVMQCNRYLKLPVSKNNISVRIRYLNAKGKRMGTQLLKNSSCEAIIDTWKTKRDREKVKIAER